MWRVWAVVTLVTCARAQLGVDEAGVVQLPQGNVLGHLDPTNSFYSFYNIPYATAPTGTNRFKAPLPPPVWMSTLDAVDRRIVCPQSGNLGLEMREDCLVANVFVPNTNANNLPVVISIHGGAYQYGLGNYATLNNIVQTSNVIVVSFNYRLGAHGFLCLGTEDAPGNAGLKDQVALLRWVNENIARFGGNPNDVTLLACSAGAGSIDVLTLSKLTNGLFHKAIAESGASFGGVGVQMDPLANAKFYAGLLNFTDVNNITALGEFYKTATYQQLLSRVDVLTNNRDSSIIFSPCIERDVGQERVLEDAPINIITRGEYTKVPLLYGFANMEGLMRISFFDEWKDAMNAKFSDFLPAELAFESEEEREEVARTVKEFYFGTQAITEQHVLPYIDYFTDLLFAYPMLRGLKHRVESLDDTIYLYEYSFVDENTAAIVYTEERGANHCEQSRAVLDENKTDATPEYIQMKGVMRELWSNFILTGSPVAPGSQLPAWPPANAARSPHMSLGRVVELKGALLEERANFLDEIFEKYSRPPVPPLLDEDSSTDGASSISIWKYLFSLILVLYYLV